METPLTATASKFIGTSGKATCMGDLINNHGFYNVPPDYKDPFHKRIHINAEKFGTVGSSFRAAYKKQYMFAGGVSGGWAAWRSLEHFLPKILEHSVRLANDEDDEPYISPQRLSDVLNSDTVADIAAQNRERSQTAIMVAANSLRDTLIIGPFHREGYYHEFKKSFAMSGGADYTDAIFEKHYWGPTIRHDVTGMIHDEDGAWSRNTSLERSMAVQIQYGSPLALDARRGQSMDVVDKFGRDVSLVDQAWEDARHLVYEITRTYTYEGKTYKARSETAAALLLSRFAHDYVWRQNLPINKGGLNKAAAHSVVKAHYASESEMKRMEELQAVMLPFLAAHCNWKTLRKALDNDPALKAFWEQQVLPTASKVKSEKDIKDAILSYLPRGGFRVPELDAFVKVKADPADPRLPFNTNSGQSVIKTNLANGFSRQFDPKIFNDRDYAKLGNNRHPRHDVDPDHETFAQGAAKLVLGALCDGVVPLDQPRTYLYLDDPAGTYEAAAFMHKNGITDPAQMAAAFDVHGNPGASFGDAIGREAAANLADRHRELALGHGYAQWRSERGVGNIISLSDIGTALNFTGVREATKTNAHEAFAADGSMYSPQQAKRAVAKRALSLYMHGIIIPAGPTTPDVAALIGEAAVVAVGLAERGGANLDYQMDFFMDYGGNNIRQLDIADLIIHLGIQVKGLLEQPKPPARPDLYIAMARLLDLYERLTDPARRNVVVERDPRTGKDIKKDIIDTVRVDRIFKRPLSARSTVTHYQQTGEHYADNPSRDAFFGRPAYKGFAVPETSKPADYYKNRLKGLGPDDMTAKVELAHDVWAWMRAAPIPAPSGKPGQNWVVTGNLLARGIQYFDDMSLDDLHADYSAAKTSWGNLNARQRANVFNQNRLSVEEPTVGR